MTEKQGMQSVLKLISDIMSTDSAYEVTDSVPVYEGHVISNGVHKIRQGGRMSIGSEAFRCTKALFQAMMLGIDIHEAIFHPIKMYNVDIRSDNHVVLSGENAMFPGLSDCKTK